MYSELKHNTCFLEFYECFVYGANRLQEFYAYIIPTKSNSHCTQNAPVVSNTLHCSFVIKHVIVEWWILSLITE